MRRLLVTGVGFTPPKIIEPAKLLSVDGVLLVYGRHTRSEETVEEVRRSLPETPLKSVAVADWDLEAIMKRLGPAVDDTVGLFGGPYRCRPLVALSAGHGLLHACLAQLAFDRGLEMVYWHQETGRLVRTSPYEMGAKKIPPRVSKVLAFLQEKGPSTAQDLARGLGVERSTVYHSLHLLQYAGIVERSPKGGTFEVARRRSFFRE